MRHQRPAVSVPPVRNATAQGEIAGWLQAGLSAELAGRGRLSDSGTPFEVQLVSIHDFPVAASGGHADAWHVDVVVHAKAGAFEDDASAGEDYLGGVDTPGTEANRRAALRRLTRDLARELVERYDLFGKTP